jgi:formylglycine-generating enzyme required for sulfatase activity
LLVPGGTFNRGYDGVDYLDPSYPATVSDFYLDKYEITVGRLRMFVNAGLGTQTSPPGDGTGAHPRIANSGWSSTWNTHLPASTAALRTALKCSAAFQTWTDTPGSNESRPVNCLDWYTAFAFCAWDGGRLPTEAEWNYAASGGSEHRYYPWSSPATSTTIDDSCAAYCGGTCTMQNVGSKSPRGDGRWGQSDLGGNAWEWNLDLPGSPHLMPCNDCANLTLGAYRVFRGGSFDDIASTLRSSARHVYYPGHRGAIGARCARTPEREPR